LELRQALQVAVLDALMAWGRWEAANIDWSVVGEEDRRAWKVAIATLAVPADQHDLAEGELQA